ncbi:MAG: PEP-utilizing enzyme, partial [Candidatus Eremiobacterota bacterium]
AERAILSRRLNQAGWPGGAGAFLRFAELAICGREEAKFEFTRHLSRALDNLVQWGSHHNLGRAELSCLSLEDLRSVQSGYPPQRPGDFLRERASEGQAWHELTRVVELPLLLVRPEDFVAFRRLRLQPNFVTTARVTAPVETLSDTAPEGGCLTGRILCTPRADPGYDWILGHAPAGLITAYGGANSHLAIRAAELGIPAAIGVGDELYERVQHAHTVELDCLNQRIRPLS